MRKTAGWLLVCLLVVPMIAAYADGTEPLPGAYYGVASYAEYSVERFGEVPAPGRMVFVEALHVYPFGLWMELPEECGPAKDNYGRGFHVALAEGENPTETRVVKTALMELAGEVVYGEILWMSGDTVMLSIIETTEGLKGDSVEITLSPEVEIIHPLQVGRTYQFIYDETYAAFCVIAVNG